MHLINYNFDFTLFFILRLNVRFTFKLYLKMYMRYLIEIDRYIGLPIFFPIFKHFTIIGFEKIKK